AGSFRAHPPGLVVRAGPAPGERAGQYAQRPLLRRLAEPIAERAPRGEPRTLPCDAKHPGQRAGIVAACGCGHAVGRSARERLGGTIDQRQAVRPLTSHGSKATTPPREATGWEQSISTGSLR